mmetsp:Transcript_14964/g.46827  ORF Transcript_14964/g.46827 Transcript_14964/m.46827 type:complete len:155 (+) Transcript_14964:1587-2051(+)
MLSPSTCSHQANVPRRKDTNSFVSLLQVPSYSRDPKSYVSDRGAEDDTREASTGRNGCSSAVVRVDAETSCGAIDMISGMMKSYSTIVSRLSVKNDVASTVLMIVPFECTIIASVVVERLVCTSDHSCGPLGSAPAKQPGSNGSSSSCALYELL